MITSIAYAKHSAFPTEEETVRIEARMAIYREKREKEIDEYMLMLKKRTSSIIKKNIKFKGKKIISVGKI